MKPGTFCFSFALALSASLPALCQAQSPYYTDTGSPVNPPWSEIYPALNFQSADPGPVNGSVIDVNNTLTEVGLFGGRPLLVPSQRIHVCCNSFTNDFPNFTRWFQTDGNTQVFRLFVNDENTANDRTGTARTEAFHTSSGWNYVDGKTFEWSGRYTIARRKQGYSIFQSKNADDDWSVQLNISGSGFLVINNRRHAEDVTVTNPDGSNKDFDGLGFDARILDDGRNYKVWIDGVLMADNYFDRPTSDTNFRWGMYLGSSILVPPADNSVILVSGAQVKSWTGILTSAKTAIIKANNGNGPGATTSWVGGVLPGLHNVATWDSTVTAANTISVGSDQVWAGLKISNPGGNVTFNGTSLLGIDEAGVDMSTTTRNLTLNCPIELRVTAPWTVASTFTATVNSALRGYGGLTLSGGGVLTLMGANEYTGPTVINAGRLRLGNGGTTGSLSPMSAISVGAGALLHFQRSNDVLQGTDFSSAPITGDGGVLKWAPGKLILTADNSYTGPTTVIAGTLQLGNGGTTGKLSTNSAISFSGGTTFEVNRSNNTIQGSGFSGEAITGNVAVTQSGTGKLTLTANNTYTGVTTINAGTLQVGNDGPTGSTGSGNIINNGTLRFDRTGALEVPNAISGSGQVIVDCPAAPPTPSPSAESTPSQAPLR
ncbi:MAG TPA: hypothetical protein DIT13_17430 [Verrucomicrobiales bacterium]|nr:hypothetical protein [Verrucomicrobiales bacterium]HRJ07316.1 autotransporter-associated beta strand repeat-containing protein [Prosthecobacter sp.]HRK14081.1 autotransporter-associated beta strand repeat-containing protein [Prosthecobacter sp.]